MTKPARRLRIPPCASSALPSGRASSASLFAVILPLLAIVPLGGLLAITFGMSEASYTIGDGKLVVKSGDLFWGSARSSSPT